MELIKYYTINKRILYSVLINLLQELQKTFMLYVKNLLPYIQFKGNNS